MRESITNLNKTQQYLQNKTAIKRSTVYLTTEDGKTENGVTTYKLVGLNDEDVFIDVDFCAYGKVVTKLNGIVLDGAEYDGQVKISYTAPVRRGENHLEVDFSLASDYELYSIRISGAVKAFDYGSRVGYIPVDQGECISVYNGAQGLTTLTYRTENDEYFLVWEKCVCGASSRLDDDTVAHFAVKDGYIDAFLVNTAVGDVVTSERLPIGGVKNICGAAGGRFYCLDEKNKLSVIRFEESLAYTVTDTDIYAKEAVANPNCDAVIIIEKDGKAWLYENFN
ncbi:MAG: hypothetical protein IJ811_01630 [Clostridia bacterium]|nr:hypothetical protein [Clostridia bacterium]